MKRLTILLCTLFFCNLSVFAQYHSALITGKGPFLKDGIKVIISVYPFGEPFLPNDSTYSVKNYSAIVNGNQFRFNIPNLNNRTYQFAFSIPKFRKFDGFMLVRPGDNLRFFYSDDLTDSVSGKGSAKIIIERQLNKLAKETLHADIKQFALLIKESQQAYIKQLAYLNSYRDKIDKQSYKMLQLQSVNSVVASVGSFLYYYGRQYSQDTIRKILQKCFRPFETGHPYYLDYSAALFSSMGYRYIYNKYLIDQIVDNGDFSGFGSLALLSKKCLYFQSHFRGNLRDKLLTILILSQPKAPDLTNNYLESIKYIKNKNSLTILNQHCLQGAGSVAENFKFTDTSNVVHRLDEYKGKVIVFDFWFTGCGNCKELLPKLKLVEKKFANNPNVTFISVSTDKNKNEWIQSVKEGVYTSDLGVNLYTNGNGINDMFIKHINFQGAPTLKLINRKGIWVENPVDCRIDDGKDLINKIEEALTN